MRKNVGFVHTERDPRVNAIPDIHGHAKGEHKPYTEERPLPLTARMLFLWFYHACRRGYPRFMMVTDHMNALTFEDPASVNLVRRALKLAQAGDLYGAAETANVEVGHAQVVSEGLRRGMRYSIGAEVDNDPRARPDAQNIVEAMRPDGLIRSVHFIPIDHPVHGPNWNWPFDNPEFASLYEHVGTEKTWELYMAVLSDALDRLPGNIVGHFYVPALFGNWPDQAVLESYEDKLLELCEARGIAIEFNTRFLYREHSDEQKQRYIDANKRLLRKAKERGVGIAVGSDAHSPRDQGNGFETVLGILDELDINEIVFPIGGRLLRVALRYIKPPEPEPLPPPPLPEPSVAIAPPVDAASDIPAAKPVRKARPAASSARPKESASERQAGTAFEAPSAQPEPEEPAAVESPPPAAKPARSKAKTASPEPAVETAPPAPAPPERSTAGAVEQTPVAPKPVKSRKAGAAAGAGEPASDGVAAPAAAGAPARPAVPVAKVKTSAKAVPDAEAAPAAASKPAPAVRSKPAPKRVPAKAAGAPPIATVKTAPLSAAKTAPVKAPAKAAMTAASKSAPAKKTPPAPGKKAAAAAAKKAAPLKKAAAKKTPVKKAAPGKKAAAKAAPAKKSTPAKKVAPLKKAAAKKTPVKKAAPAKKKAPAAKKPAPKGKAPVKKSSAKKPAAKRR